MGNVHIWLFATQIVGIAVIAMFAVYVLLQFVDLNKYRSTLIDREESLKKTLDSINKELETMHETSDTILEEILRYKKELKDNKDALEIMVGEK